MSPELLALILKDIVIPEVLAAVRAHSNATNGRLPSDEEVLRALDLDAARVIAVGERWLQAHK